jgi:hypothetical protein
MDSNLQNKLQQFSAAPPDGVWDKIAGALDEEPFSQRLYQYEENPPVTAWHQIEKELAGAEHSPARVVPFTTRFRKPLRYVAVACIMAVILVTITLTVRRTEAGAIDTAGNTTVPESNTVVETNSRSAEQTAATPQQPNRKTTRQTTDPAKENETPGVVAANGNNKQQAFRPDTRYASLNEYVFFRDGDGKMRKIAKKLAAYVNCKANDSNCQQRLQELRQKMAANAMTTDFTGILDMLRQLQQKP